MSARLVWGFHPRRWTLAWSSWTSGPSDFGTVIQRFHKGARELCKLAFRPRDMYPCPQHQPWEHWQKVMECIGQAAYNIALQTRLPTATSGTTFSETQNARCTKTSWKDGEESRGFTALPGRPSSTEQNKGSLHLIKNPSGGGPVNVAGTSPSRTLGCRPIPVPQL